MTWANTCNKQCSLRPTPNTCFVYLKSFMRGNTFHTFIEAVLSSSYDSISGIYVHLYYRSLYITEYLAKLPLIYKMVSRFPKKVYCFEIVVKLRLIILNGNNGNTPIRSGQWCRFLPVLVLLCARARARSLNRRGDGTDGPIEPTTLSGLLIQHD